MRLIIILILFSLQLPGQESFYTSFGTPEETSNEVCNILVSTQEKLYALTTKEASANTFSMVFYQVDPSTGAFTDSLVVEQDTKRNIVAAAGNKAGGIFIIHRHWSKDDKIVLFDTKTNTVKQQPLTFPDGYTLDKIWSGGKDRWLVGAKPKANKVGYHILQFNGLVEESRLQHFLEGELKVNDLIELPNSNRLIVGSLRDSAALVWMANDTISRIKTYGKATDKYNMDLRYNIFGKVLSQDTEGMVITGGYAGMGNEVIIDLDQNYDVLRDTVSMGKYPDGVKTVTASPLQKRSYSLKYGTISVADRSQEPIYIYRRRGKDKIVRPEWDTNDICLSPDGQILISAGTKGRANKDLNFTLTAYSKDLQDTIWHREVGKTGRNTSYSPEGIAANKDGTIFTLLKKPADVGFEELILESRNEEPQSNWRTRVARFPEGTTGDAALMKDRNGQLVVVADEAGREASRLYRYDRKGKLLSEAIIPRASHYDFNPRLLELKDGRLLATSSVPFVSGKFDPSDALTKGYSAGDYLSRFPALLVMTPDGKTTHNDTLFQLRKGRLTDVVELKRNELIICGYSQKPLEASVSRYNLNTRKRTWAKTLSRPGYDLSRARSVVPSRNGKFYDVLCEYQKNNGQHTDLMIYRFGQKNRIIDSLFIEHPGQHLYGAELHRTKKGDLLLRYGLGEGRFSFTDGNERLRLVLIKSKQLEIKRAKYYEGFEGATIPSHSTAFGKKGHAILGTMDVDGRYSMDLFQFRMMSTTFDEPSVTPNRQSPK
jgi:hypothetical protein